MITFSVTYGWPDNTSPAAYTDLLKVATADASIPVTRAWVVSNCGVSSDLLRQWIRRGHVRTTPTGDVNFVDVLRRLTTGQGDTT